MHNHKITDTDKKGKERAGPPAWAVLHNFSAAYVPSPETAAALKQLWVLYSVLFPCEVCREHLKANLKKYPIDNYLSNRDDAYFYSYMIHDVVNKSIGKTSPPYEKIKEETFRLMGSKCSNCRLEK